MKAAAAAAAKRASASVTTVFGDEPYAALLLGLNKPPLPGASLHLLTAADALALWSSAECSAGEEKPSANGHTTAPEDAKAGESLSALLGYRHVTLCLQELRAVADVQLITVLVCSHDEASGSEAGSEPGDGAEPESPTSAAAAAAGAPVGAADGLDAEVCHSLAWPLLVVS